MDKHLDYCHDSPVEIVLWIILVLVALTMRVASLGYAPLTSAEAHEAMMAWRAVEGEGMPATSDYSPLLLAGNLLLFFLFGAGDALARLWPALFGTLLVFTPLLLRRRLGRWGTLAAGAYLTISPTALIASRRVDGTIIASASVMLLLGGLVRFWETERRNWLVLAAVGLALALTSDATAYGLLLPLVLAYVLVRYILRFTFDVSRIAPYASQFILALIPALLTFSVALGWNPTGLSAVGQLLTRWLSRFRAVSDSVPSPFILLLTYEPLALMLGLGGVIWLAIEGRHARKRDEILLVVWAGMTFLLLLLMPGRASLDLLWVVLPLALTLGSLVECLEQTVHRRPVWLGEAVYVLIALVLWVHTYLNLARYVTYARSADLMLVLLSLLIQIILLISFALAIDDVMALRDLTLSSGVALLGLTLSAGWGAAYINAADASEALIERPTDPAVRDLVQTVTGLSWRETGLPTALPFAYQASPNSTLAWYLREFQSTRRVDRISDATPDTLGALLITPGREAKFYAENEYRGHPFVLERAWSLQEINCSFWSLHCVDAIRWFLFRDTPTVPSPTRWATIWQERDLPAGK